MKLHSDVFNINKDKFIKTNKDEQKEKATLVVINTTFSTAALLDQCHVVYSRHMFLLKLN